jgi:hypothetical protein
MRPKYSRSNLQKCKGYFAVNKVISVNLILPPVCPKGIDKHGMGCIMRIMIREVLILAAPGLGVSYECNGGGTSRHKERVSAQRCSAQCSPRTGSGWIVSGPYLFRCLRPSAGQVRNAASGYPRRSSGWCSSSEFWILKGNVLPGIPAVCNRRISGFAAAAERTQAGIQDHRGRDAVSAANVGRRTGFAGCGFAAEGSTTIGSLPSPTQHRAGAGAVPKKRYMAQREPTTFLHSLARSSRELLVQYENLRSQVLAPMDGGSPHPSLEQWVIEHQGMAAWMKSVPDILPTQRGKEIPLSPEWVSALVDLVIGSRREVQDEQPQ